MIKVHIKTEIYVHCTQLSENLSFILMNKLVNEATFLTKFLMCPDLNSGKSTEAL